ncbi:MAG: HDOD domain-containing protein [Pseudomonadota bacterium]
MMTATATKTNRIPTLENGAAQLLLEIADGDVDMDRIVQLVQISPSIAAKLLSTANSAWSNPVRPVTSITDACSRLGLNVVRTTTIALAIGQSFDPKRCPAFDAERFWCTSILASRLASELAPRFGVDANTAATAALLNNIGMLWLADSMPEAMSAAFDCTTAADGPSLSECLRESCGMDRREASQLLFSAWRLPEALTGANADPQSPQRLIIDVAETMATEIYAETALDEATCAEDDNATTTVYTKISGELEKTQELAAILF